MYSIMWPHSWVFIIGSNRKKCYFYKATFRQDKWSSDFDQFIVHGNTHGTTLSHMTPASNERWRHLGGSLLQPFSFSFFIYLYNTALCFTFIPLYTVLCCCQHCEFPHCRAKKGLLNLKNQQRSILFYCCNKRQQPQDRVKDQINEQASVQEEIIKLTMKQLKINTFFILLFLNVDFTIQSHMNFMMKVIVPCSNVVSHVRDSLCKD